MSVSLWLKPESQPGTSVNHGIWVQGNNNNDVTYFAGYYNDASTMKAYIARAKIGVAENSIYVNQTFSKNLTVRGESDDASGAIFDGAGNRSRRQKKTEALIPPIFGLNRQKRMAAERAQFARLQLAHAANKLFDATLTLTRRDITGLALASALHEHNAEQVYLSYFGQADPAYYGIQATAIPETSSSASP